MAFTHASAERQGEESPGIVFTDGLGDRYLARDPDTGDAIERFQLIPDLGAQERALRERVDRLLNFRHVRYPNVRGLEVQTVAQKKTTWLMSDHTPGLRLSSVLAFVARHETLVFDVNAALQVAREVLPALAVLHDSRGVTHGAMGLERLVIMPHGRVVIVDYALGLALERLQYPRTRLWRDFHVAMPPSAGLSRFDTRADVANVALALLTLLLGRPLAGSEFPKAIPGLVDGAYESLPNGTVRPLSSSLKSWFERALPIEARRSFSTALDANLALEDVIKRERAYAPTPAALKSFLQRYDSCSGSATASEPVHGSDRGAWKSSHSRAHKSTRAAATLRVAPRAPEPANDDDDEIRALEAELARLAREEAEQQSREVPRAAVPIADDRAEQVPAPRLTLVPGAREANAIDATTPALSIEPAAAAAPTEPMHVDDEHGSAATEVAALTRSTSYALDAPAEVEIVVMGEPLPALDVATLHNGEAATMIVPPRERDADRAATADKTGCVASDSDEEIRALELLLQQVQAEEEAARQDSEPMTPGASDATPATAAVDVAPVADAPARIEDLATDDSTPAWTLTPPDDAACATLESEPTDEAPIRDTATLPLDFETVPVPDYVTALVAAGFVNDSLAAEPGVIDAADITRLQMFVAFAPTEPAPLVLPFKRSRAIGVAGAMASAPGLPERTTDQPASLATQPTSVLATVCARSADEIASAPLRLVPASPRRRLRRPRPVPAIAAEAMPVEARLQTVPQAAALVVVEAPTLSSVEAVAHPDVQVAEPLVVEDTVAQPATETLGTGDRFVDSATAVVTAEVTLEPLPTAGAGDIEGAAIEATEPSRTDEEPAHSVCDEVVAIDHERESTAFIEEAGVDGPETVCAEQHSEASTAHHAATVVAAAVPDPSVPGQMSIEPDTVPSVVSAEEELEHLLAQLGGDGAARDPELQVAVLDDTTCVSAQPLDVPAVESELRAQPGRIEEPADTTPDDETASRTRADQPRKTRRRSSRKRRRSIDPAPERVAPIRRNVPEFAIVPSAVAAPRLDSSVTTTSDKANAVDVVDTTRPEPVPQAPFVRLVGIDRDATSTGREYCEEEPAPALVYEPWRVPTTTTTAPPLNEAATRPVPPPPADPWNVEAEAAKVAQVVPFTSKPIEAVPTPATAGVAAPIAPIAAAVAAPQSPPAVDAIPRVLAFEAKPSKELVDSPVEPAPSAEPDAPRRWRINWKRTAAASLAVILLEGVAFAMAYWLINPGQDGSLLVQTTPPGVQVLIDGRKSGATPLAVKLRAGRHTLEMRGFGTTKVVPVEISAGVQTTQTLNWSRSARTGKLKVTTSPAGARVLVDGAYRGTAPLTIDDVTIGAHQVSAQSAAGTVKSSVKVEADEVAEVDLGIFSGWLSVFAPIEVRIFDGGKLLGTSLDGKLLISPGPHTIELVNSRLGYREKRTVEIEPGKHTPLSVTAPNGTIIVEAPDGTEVVVDGQSAGTMPMPRVAAPIGTREVVLKHPSIGERRLTLTVGADAPVRVSLIAPQ